MHRSYSLSKRHFARNWQVRDFADRHDRDEVNKKAYEFATSEDTEKRQEIQLWLLECFHGYLLKYLNMIIYGQLPAMNSPQGKDAQLFLKLLIDRKKYPNPSLSMLRNECKSLHISFKEQETTDEVYDTLVLLFLAVCEHYDPLYPKKTEKVCKFIEKQPADAIIKPEDIAAAVGFDPVGCIRILVRRGYLASVPGPRKSTLGYRTGTQWPPPKKLFQISSMGFTGYAQHFFRLYLKNYIEDKRKELESQERVFQLDYMQVSQSHSDGEDTSEFLELLPHSEGSWADSRGVRWSADTALMERWKTLDISKMDEAWIQRTDDFLFKNLTPRERHLLYLVFVREYTWAEIAEVLQCDSEIASRDFKEIMTYLEGRYRVYDQKFDASVS